MIDCPHWSDGACGIAAALAGRVLCRVGEDACRYCLGCDAPRAINRATVSIAMGCADPATRARLGAEYAPILEVRAVGVDLVLEGPGTEFRRLLEQLGIRPATTCNCTDRMLRMNALGPAGCRRERERLLEEIRAAADGYGLVPTALAGLRAIATGLAARISLVDPIGSLFDEAVRRAEKQDAPSC